jgi:type IV secretory pathway VirD2 relaxase
MERLRTLERMGLAERNTPGNWQIDAELEAKLRRMGERGDIVKTMHRELAAAGVSRAAGNYAILIRSAPVSGWLGALLARGSRMS